MNFQWLHSFIPSKVNNGTVIRFFEFLRRLERVSDRRIAENRQKNTAAFPAHAGSIEAAGGFIEDQQDWKDLAFGKVTMAYSGCEVFAVYNALVDLSGGKSAALPDLICDFEHDGIVLSGKFGTAPKAIADYFCRHAFRVEFTTDVQQFDAVAGRNDCLILTLYNDVRDIRKMVHSVCVSKNNGLYTAHNIYCSGVTAGPFESVSALLRNVSGGHAGGISLTGIRK